MILGRLKYVLNNILNYLNKVNTKKIEFWIFIVTPTLK